MTSSSTIEMILSFSQQYTISTSLIIFILGLIGNSLNIFVFTKIKDFQNNQCVFYLLVESFIDLGVLIFNSVLRILTFLYGCDLSSYITIWCKLKTIIGQTFLLSLFSVICFAAFDQFLSTSYSVYLRQRNTLETSRYLIIIAICFSLAHSIIPAAFFYVKPPVDCVPFHPIVIKYYSYFFYPVLCGFLPIFISGSFSILAYRNVHRIVRRQLPIVRRRLDRQLTTFVLTRVAFLILFSTPFVVYRIYAINANINPTDSLRVAIERLIQAVLNSVFSLNCAVKFCYESFI
jgi:hypothetical protein